MKELHRSFEALLPPPMRPRSIGWPTRARDTIRIRPFEPCRQEHT